MCCIPALTAWVIYAPAPSEMTGRQSWTGSFLMLMKLLHLETKRDLSQVLQNTVMMTQGFSSYRLLGRMSVVDGPLWFPLYWPAETNQTNLHLITFQDICWILSFKKKKKKENKTLQKFDHHLNTEQLILPLRAIRLMDVVISASAVVFFSPTFAFSFLSHSLSDCLTFFHTHTLTHAFPFIFMCFTNFSLQHLATFVSIPPMLISNNEPICFCSYSPVHNSCCYLGFLYCFSANAEKYKKHFFPSTHN